MDKMQRFYKWVSKRLWLWEALLKLSVALNEVIRKRGGSCWFLVRFIGCAFNDCRDCVFDSIQTDVQRKRLQRMARIKGFVKWDGGVLNSIKVLRQMRHEKKKRYRSVSGRDRVEPMWLGNFDYLFPVPTGVMPGAFLSLLSEFSKEMANEIGCLEIVEQIQGRLFEKKGNEAYRQVCIVNGIESDSIEDLMPYYKSIFQYATGSNRFDSEELQENWERLQTLAEIERCRRACEEAVEVPVQMPLKKSGVSKRL